VLTLLSARDFKIKNCSRVDSILFSANRTEEEQHFASCQNMENADPNRHFLKDVKRIVIKVLFYLRKLYYSFGVSFVCCVTNGLSVCIVAWTIGLCKWLRLFCMVLKVGTAVVTRQDGRVAVGKLGALCEQVALYIYFLC